MLSTLASERHYLDVGAAGCTGGSNQPRGQPEQLGMAAPRTLHNRALAYLNYMALPILIESLTEFLSSSKRS
jgi:hypothetical protein